MKQFIFYGSAMVCLHDIRYFCIVQHSWQPQNAEFKHLKSRIISWLIFIHA